MLAGELPGVGRERMCADMDAWGYSVRVGTARLWFEQDAEDAVQWLLQHGLVKYQSGHAEEQLAAQPGSYTTLSPTWLVRNQ
jgi:hypothetical protein